MKKSLFNVVVALGLLSQLFVACQKNEIEPSNDPGKFLITTDQSSSSSKKSVNQPKIEFDLGTLITSKQFLFMIANGGDNPIFDVELSSDKEAFDLSPRTIPFLPGKNGGIIPIVNLTVTQEGSFILPEGLNVANIQIKGKTLSKKDTITVYLEFAVKVTVPAKPVVLESKIFSGDSEAVNIESGGMGGLIVEPAKGVKIFNGGTTLMTVSATYWKRKIVVNPDGTEYLSTEQSTVTNEVVIQPGETINITDIIAFVGTRMEGTTKYSSEGGYTSLTLTGGTIFGNSWVTLLSQ